MPRLPRRKPPPQQKAATMPTVRGPTFSSHFPAKEAQKHYGDGENPDNLLQSPIARSTDHNTTNASQRGVKDAPRVDRADAQVNGYRCRRNPPPVEARPSNDAFLGEEL